MSWWCGMALETLLLGKDFRSLKAQKFDIKFEYFSRLPYYFDSNKMTVAFTTTIKNGVMQNAYFSARIGIARLGANRTRDTCKFRTEGTKSIWETDADGYINNVFCQQVIPIAPRHQLYANVTFFQLEKWVDIIRFYSDEELLHPYNIEDAIVYVFLPDSNKTRNLRMEFLSDASVIGKGFRIEYESVGGYFRFRNIC